MKYFCVVSHTHWDREWYMPLERFKLKLVDLIDHLLATLEKYPAYIFHLDAQTVVLEDYLEYRPSRRETLRRYITEGRLVVGPWYLQNDFYLTSGESTIRILLEGRRIAASFGNCGKVGYAADQFGNISQLPQILNNFGLDNFVFGRGLADYEVGPQGEVITKTTPSEFIWEGADGSRVLAIHMAFWYNNAQRFSEDIEVSKLLLDCVEKQFEGVAVTPYLLLMNGVDHLEAQDNLLPILDTLQKDYAVRQYHMEAYIRQVQAYIEEHQVPLKTYKGELRHGGDLKLLKGTLSSRSYLKTANVRAQNMLECRLEPLYAMLQLYGAAPESYSLDHFRYMWKNLMKNHPHDSICGCSRDEVHRHMEDNYARLSEVTNDMLARGLRELAEHMELAEESADSYILLAVNSTETEQSGVLKAVVDIPASDDFAGFTITDAAGSPVEYALLSKERTHRDVFSPVNLPGVLDVDRYTLYLYAQGVQPFAAKGYRIRRAERTPALFEPLQKSEPVMENACIRVTVGEDGRVDLLDKKTERLYEDILDIEESADYGDSYMYWNNGEPFFWGRDFPAAVEVLEHNAYRQAIRITREMCVPAYYDFSQKKRAEQLAVCTVELTLSIEKGDALLHVGYTLDNRAKDHRMRLVFHAGIASQISTADIPFDIVSHAIHDSYPTTKSPVFPNTSFALLEDEEAGFAVLTEGLHEYEHLDERQALAFTMVRSTGSIVRNMETLEQIGGSQWDCPENQCLRRLEGRLAVYTYTGGYVRAGLPQVAKRFRNPLIAYATACDRKKFSGGRTAVQDTRLSELFYLPDDNAALRVADNTPAVEIAGEGVLVTAFKKAEDGQGLILRLLNYSESEQTAVVTAAARGSLTTMSEEGQTYIGEGRIALSLKPKELVTLRLDKLETD